MSNDHRERGPIHPPRPEVEVAEEIAEHLSLLTERYIREGMSPVAARAAAEARFGDPSDVRDATRPFAEGIEQRRRLREYVDELRLDIFFAGRTLVRSPLFAAMAILTLAVAIGANAAMFSVVNRVLIRPLPYANAERVWTIANSYPGTGLLEAAVSPAEFADLQEQLGAFDALAALRPQPMSLTGDCASAVECEPQRVSAYLVSPNIFDMLGASAILGTTFRPDDGAGAGAATVVLSHALWVQRFGSDSSIIGKAIIAAGIPRTVIGVMKREVRFPDAPLGYVKEPAALWIPFDWARLRNDGRGNQFLVVLGRARMDAGSAALRADLDLVESRFRRDFPERYIGPSQWRLAETPLRAALLGDVRPALLVLWGIVGTVLLIGCANVANLLLARSASREAEMAVRASLGAGRGRIVRQLISETLVLALIAGSLGLVLGLIALNLVRAIAPPTLPQLADVGFDGTVVAFVIAVTIISSVACGVLPAVHATRSDIYGALRSGSRAVRGSRVAARVRRALVIGEVALTLVALVSAGLLLRTFGALQSVSPAFQPDGVTSFEVTLPRVSYPDAASIVAFHRRIRDAIEALPGVIHVGAVLPLPLAGEGWSGSWYPEGWRRGPGEELPNTQYNVALPGYFATMSIPVLQGREFTDDDDEASSKVAIVSTVLAEKHWPGQSAIGKRINTIDMEDGTFATIVGVVPTVLRQGATEAEEPQLYLPLAQKVERRISYVVRVNGDPSSATRAIRGAVRGVDGSLPLARLSSMRDLLQQSVAPQRFNATLLTVFAAVALVLAAGGLFGVVSFLASQRDHELGVRVALGGSQRDIIRLVLGEGASMAFSGILIGLVCTWFASRAMSGLLFGVGTGDPFTWIGVAGLLAFVSLLASWIPARRAARVDPLIALREG